MMRPPVAEIVDSYDPHLPLAQAWTIPAAWYVDARVLELERQTVFTRSWQLVGRAGQLRTSGDFVTFELPGGDPVVVVRGDDGALRGFFNVCRHHAAAVATAPQGSARMLRCPYHGWTYALDGSLKGTPDFAGVCDSIETAAGWCRSKSASGSIGCSRGRPRRPATCRVAWRRLVRRVAGLNLETLRWMERRSYTVDCNWKVFVDNYLDGGYHVPHLHKGLGSVLDYSGYTIENGERFCLQSSPMVRDGAEERTGAVRTGDRASYSGCIRTS